MINYLDLVDRVFFALVFGCILVICICLICSGLADLTRGSRRERELRALRKRAMDSAMGRVEDD